MDLRDKILKLKEEREAIILAHYYQLPEIQEIADYVGDSYYLSKIAKGCKEQVIVFCGVKFMAESAKVISKEKIVLLPVLEAVCPMADMATKYGLIKLKKKYPRAKVVSYINSSTEVKALSDLCCTSSNAYNIIKSLSEEEIIFLPDKNLGSYIKERIPNKKIILWEGFCNVHEDIKKEDVLGLKKCHEKSLIAVHPECSKDVRSVADFLGSTKDIINFVKGSKEKDFIIVTEEGILYELEKENKDKNFYIPKRSMVCNNMKKTTLKELYKSLLNMENKIEIEEPLRIKAYNALENMHKLGG